MPIEQVGGIDFVESQGAVGATGVTRVARVGGTLQQSVDGGAFGALGGGTVHADGTTITGDGSVGNPLVAASQFGSDTTINLPNASSTQVAALELITSLLVNTPGSEKSQWLFKMLEAGTSVKANVLTMSPGQLTTDTNALTPWTWSLKIAGSEVGRVTMNSAGQLALMGTQGAAALRFFGDLATTEIFRAGVNNGISVINGAISTKQGTNIASANNLTLVSAAANGGNIFNITGTTQINLIDENAWQRGARVVLSVASTTVVKHNQTASSNFVPIFFASGADFTATASSHILDLVLIGSNSGAGPDVWYCTNH